MAIRHVKQGKNECTLAAIAMLTDAPFEVVKAHACRAARVATWTQVFDDPDPRDEAYWAGVRGALLGIGRMDLYEPLSQIQPSTGRVLSNRIRSLPLKGRGTIRFSFGKCLHVAVWEDGLIYDSDLDPRPRTLSEYRRETRGRVIHVLRLDEDPERGRLFRPATVRVGETRGTGTGIDETEVLDFLEVADAGGIACKFYSRDGEGFKLFACKEERDYAYEQQKTCAEHGLAPNVYERFEARSPQCHHRVQDGDCHRPDVRDDCLTVGRWWGYKTQLAEVVDPTCTLSGSPWRPNRDDLNDLYEALRDAGLPCNDLHDWNVGELNGRLVRIDFGMEST